MHANNREESSAESGDDLIIQMIGFQRAADVTPLRFSHMLQTVFVVLASSASDLDFHQARFLAFHGLQYQPESCCGAASSA